MRIMIEIPEDFYYKAKRGFFELFDIREVRDAIANGTPLPKGHGRLGDLDRLYNVFARNVVSANAFKELFDYAPTIIPADKEGEG